MARAVRQEPGSRGRNEVDDLQELAGACQEEFRSETFEEMAELSKSHAEAMTERGDRAHIEKMNEMRALATKPGAAEAWFEKMRRDFDALPEV